MPGGVVEDHDRATAAQVSPPQGGALADGVRYLRRWHGQHLEQSLQGLGRVERSALGIMGLKVEVQRPVRILPGDLAGGADRQRGLSHARHALDDGGAGLPGEQLELVVAAHEFHGLRRKSVGRGHPARPLTGRAHGQVGVAAENALMEFGQRRPRFRALLINQAAAGFPVEAQCVGWPAAPVQGGHLVRDERFVQRVLRQQMRKLAHQVGVPADLQLASDPLENRGAALLFEAVPHP